MNYYNFHSDAFQPTDEYVLQQRFQQWNPFQGNNGQTGFPFVPPPTFPGGGGSPFTPPPPPLPGGGFPFPGTQPGFPSNPFPELPGGGGNQFGGDAPTTPPPSFAPQQQNYSTFAVDPGSMRRCLRKFTFVWLNNGRSFWFYPTYIGRTSVAGYRWRGGRWVYYGTDADRIRSFQCY